MSRPAPSFAATEVLAKPALRPFAAISWTFSGQIQSTSLQGLRLPNALLHIGIGAEVAMGEF